MNNKYLLLVELKKNQTESYYSDDVEKLKQYAEMRKFSKYAIYELKKIFDCEV